MKRTIPLYILLTLVAITTVQAATYQSEADFFINNTKVDPDTDLKITAIGAAIYFAPVRTSGPLAEADFMSRASGISIMAGTADSSIGSFNIDGDALSLLLNYILPGSDFGIKLSHSTLELSAGGLSSDITDNTFELGRYFSPYRYFGVSYGDETTSFSGLPDETVKSLGLSAKWLVMNGENTVNLEAGYHRNEITFVNVFGFNDKAVNSELSLSGDYYLDNTFSVGIGYIYNAGDNIGTEGSTISLDVRKFFSESHFLEYAYSSFSADSADDSNSHTIRFGMRF